MTITTTFVTVLRRFKYLAEKVMYSNHYNKHNKTLQASCLGCLADLLHLVYRTYNPSLVLQPFSRFLFCGFHPTSYSCRAVLLRAKKVGHQISVSFEKFDVV
jgi:hypothetical protein